MRDHRLEGDVVNSSLEPQIDAAIEQNVTYNNRNVYVILSITLYINNNNYYILEVFMLLL